MAIFFCKELTAAKEEVPHGEWQNWLDENFKLKERMAQNFMKCWERFGKTHLNADLNQTQMIELLALPEADTEKFIAQKKNEGTPVEKLRKEKTQRAGGRQ